MMINLVILTGIDGSGKSSALNIFKEANYYVAFNIPLEVMKSFFDTILCNKNYENIAICVPLNIANDVYFLSKQYKQLNVKFLGLTCSKQTLIERYRLSRRNHSLQCKGYSLEEAIDLDYLALEKIRLNLTNYIDTTKLGILELKRDIYSSIIGKHDGNFSIMFMSFGYKKGIPQDIETVLDVRFLPNPYWVDDLKELNGLDSKVKDYVLNFPQTKKFLSEAIKYLDYYFDEVKKSGRDHINIGIACTGGQHRSVVIAQYLCDYFLEKYQTSVIHRGL